MPLRFPMPLRLVLLSAILTTLALFVALPVQAGHNFSAGTAVVAVEVTVAAGVPTPDGSIELLIARADDPLFPSTAFFADFSVNLTDPTVTGVTLSTPQTSLPLTLFGTSWDGDFDFTSLSALKTALQGPVTIQVSGGTIASTSTFAFNVNSLVDGDFFPLSTITNPLHGATGVASDVTFAWTDPTGAAAPDFLEVAVEANMGSAGQFDDSDTGTLLVTDVSWQPPVALADGAFEFDATYIDFDSTPFVASAIQVSTGNITWGDSSFAPPGYPAATPLVALGSTSIVGLTVPEPGSPLLAMAALLTLALLRRSK